MPGNTTSLELEQLKTQKKFFKKENRIHKKKEKRKRKQNSHTYTLKVTTILSQGFSLHHQDSIILNVHSRHLRFS